jgi:hypothetical protein
VGWFGDGDGVTMRLKTRHGCWWEAYKQGPTRKRLRRQRMKLMRRMTEAEQEKPGVWFPRHRVG